MCERVLEKPGLLEGLGVFCGSLEGAKRGLVDGWDEAALEGVRPASEFSVSRIDGDDAVALSAGVSLLGVPARDNSSGVGFDKVPRIKRERKSVSW